MLLYWQEQVPPNGLYTNVNLYVELGELMTSPLEPRDEPPKNKTIKSKISLIFVIKLNALLPSGRSIVTMNQANFWFLHTKNNL